MKKSLVRAFIAVMLAVFLVLSLSGCDSPDPYDGQTPVAVAVVLGNHANAMGLNLNNPDLAETVSDAAFNGFVSVVSCDGQPQIINADIYAIPPQYRQADPAKLAADAKAKAANILTGLAGVKAEHPELDTLAALTQAVRSFAAAPEDSRKIIYVIDTGLSTAGQLDFRNHLLNADPTAIAEALAERSAIPDFTGVTVRWSQIGDIAAPQEPLSYAQVQKLGAIWTAIIEKGGGTIELSGVPSNQIANDAEQFPPISAVDLPPELPITFKSAAPEEAFDPTVATVFSEQQVRFVGDSAEYVDPEKAETTLRPAAEYMTKHPEFKGLLIGTTATGGKEVCLKLSQSRAEAVRDTLVSMGVPGEHLITLGLGCDDPWHIHDTDSRGCLIESRASRNRKVVLMAADSDEALAILGE